MSPGEHGEVFVLDDGSETDLDLGNYERFLDVKLTNDSNLTTGKIYQDIIRRERAGEYLGKTVQIIPHVTDEIIRRIRELSTVSVSNDCSVEEPDVCVIELGGTIGDLESGASVYISYHFPACNEATTAVASGSFLDNCLSMLYVAKSCCEGEHSEEEKRGEEKRGELTIASSCFSFCRFCIEFNAKTKNTSHLSVVIQDNRKPYMFCA